MILDSSDPSAQHTSTEGNVPQAPPAYFQFQPPNGAPPSNYYASGSPQESEKSSEKAPPYSQDSQPYTTGGGYLQASSSRQAPYPSPPAGQTSPGQSGSNSSGGFMSRLTGSQPSDLLNPPPPSFSRPPQQNFPYTPFHTVVHISLGATLDKGFPMMPPPAVGGQPHPFMTHDVNEEDWTRLLGDLKKAGTLSPMNKILAGVAPMVILPGIGFVGGMSYSVLYHRPCVDGSVRFYVKQTFRKTDDQQENGPYLATGGSLEPCTSCCRLVRNGYLPFTFASTSSTLV